MFFFPGQKIGSHTLWPGLSGIVKILVLQQSLGHPSLLLGHISFKSFLIYPRSFAMEKGYYFGEDAKEAHHRSGNGGWPGRPGEQPGLKEIGCQGSRRQDHDNNCLPVD